MKSPYRLQDNINSPGDRQERKLRLNQNWKIRTGERAKQNGSIKSIKVKFSLGVSSFPLGAIASTWGAGANDEECRTTKGWNFASILVTSRARRSKADEYS